MLPPPPWYYAGDLLTVEYRTDPKLVADLLPAPLSLAPEDPGAIALIWADWQSCGGSKEEMLDPVSAQYKESFAVLRCSFEGRTYSHCIYIWVDKDFRDAARHPSGLSEEIRLGTLGDTARI